eukprot:scaffold473436_cov35-Attheya_sp.AAC.1
MEAVGFQDGLGDASTGIATGAHVMQITVIGCLGQGIKTTFGRVIIIIDIIVIIIDILWMVI